MIRFALAFVLFAISFSTAQVRNPMPGWMAPSWSSPGAAISDSLAAAGYGGDSNWTMNDLVVENLTAANLNVADTTPGLRDSLLVEVRTNSLVAKGPWVDVTFFGAVGDSSTDNTAAFEEALDTLAARGGGTLFIPAGVFLTTPIYWPANGINAVGVGPASVIAPVCQNTSAYGTKWGVININGTQPDSISDITFSNFRVIGGRTDCMTGSFGPDMEAVDVNVAKRIYFHNMTFEDGIEAGLDLDSASDIGGMNNRYVNSGGDGLHVSAQVRRGYEIGSIATGNGYDWDRNGFGTFSAVSTTDFMLMGTTAYDNNRNYRLSGLRGQNVGIISGPADKPDSVGSTNAAVTAGAVYSSMSKLSKGSGFRGVLTDTTTGSENSAIAFDVWNNGSIAERIRIGNFGRVGFLTTTPLGRLTLKTGTANAISTPAKTWLTGSEVFIIDGYRGTTDQATYGDLVLKGNGSGINGVLRVLTSPRTDTAVAVRFTSSDTIPLRVYGWTRGDSAYFSGQIRTFQGMVFGGPSTNEDRTIRFSNTTGLRTECGTASQNDCTWLTPAGVQFFRLPTGSDIPEAPNGISGTHLPTNQQMGDSNITLSALTEYLQTTTSLSESRTVTLLAPSVYGHRCFEIQDFAGAINGSNDIEISAGGRNINGSAASVNMVTQYASIKICARPATDDFFIAGQYP